MKKQQSNVASANFENIHAGERLHTIALNKRLHKSLPSCQEENIAVRRVDATNELEAIEQAVSGLYRPDYRRILIEKYLAYPPKPNWQIAQAIGFERTAFQELLNNAILAFAELYRDGKLVVEC